jgi:hypothetical protein
MQQSFRIHPLDQEPDIAIGLSLPLNSSKTTFFALNYTTKDQATTNLKMLLLTIPGERVMLPTYGTNIRKILFESDDSDIVNNIGVEIEEKMKIWVPYITLHNVELSKDSDKHLLYIKIFYSLNTDNVISNLTVELNVL